MPEIEIDKSLLEKADLLKLKIDVLDWVAFFPPTYAMIIKKQSKLIVETLNRKGTSPGLLAFVVYELHHLADNVDFALNEILDFLSRDKCQGCTKCDEMKDILRMLLENRDIEKVQEMMGERIQSREDGRPIRKNRPPVEVIGVPVSKETLDGLNDPHSGPEHIARAIETVLLQIFRTMGPPPPERRRPLDIEDLIDDFDPGDNPTVNFVDIKEDKEKPN